MSANGFLCLTCDGHREIIRMYDGKMIRCPTCGGSGSLSVPFWGNRLTEKERRQVSLVRALDTQLEELLEGFAKD